MAQPTHDIVTPSEVGFLQLRSAQDPLFMMKAGFLSKYKGQTRKDYEADVEIFFGWCRRMGLNPLEAKRPHIEFYIRWLEETGWAKSTISRRYGTVAVMYKTTARDDLIAKDPCEAVDRPEVNLDEQKRTILTPLEYGRFTAAAAEFGPTAQAMVFLLGVNALRIAEACSLNIEAMTIEGGYDVINFIGKGGKQFAAPLSVPAMRAVRAAIGTRTEGPILLNEWGNRMRRANATLLIRKIAASAKVNTDISPHSLRRTCATTAARMGIPVQDIQALLRHRQINTTMRYIKKTGGHEHNATHQIAAFLGGMGG